MSWMFRVGFLLVLQAITLLLLCTTVVGESDSSTPHLLIVLATQNHPHHEKYAKLTESYIEEQAKSIKDKLSVEVDIFFEDWLAPSLWTFYPFLEEIADEYRSDGINWVLIIQEYTEVNLVVLETLIAGLDSTKPQFIGKALQDKERAIIHHFADTAFKYPDTSCGILLSWPVVTRKPNKEPIDFNIDPKHELAKYLYDEGQGVMLTDAAEFCTADASDTDVCATRYSIDSTLCPASSTHKAVTEEDIFVMVKTGEVFHETRVPLQLRLWTGKVKNKEICSEKLDETIPTVKVDAPNTEQGHCAKFLAILKRASQMEHIQSKRWLVIVDDDTMMNITRLGKLLSCYSTEEPVAVGERYGYRAHDTTGYSYITGGGGTVLNMAAVNALIKYGHRCPKDDSPDDMMLGVWLQHSRIPILHSPLFHQAQPSSYPPKYIESHKPYAISFHKYKPEDPETVAREWLSLTPDVEQPTPDAEQATPDAKQHTEL